MNNHTSGAEVYDRPPDSEADPEVSKLSPLYSQSHIKPAYKKIVLISHRRHVAKLSADTDTLTICTDWLAWRHCVDAGYHSLHIEALLMPWPEERGDPDMHRYQSSTWMNINGADITLFRGVSLGKMFNRQMDIFRHGFLRIWHALDRACEQYQPDTLEFYDIRAEYDYLDEEGKKDLVSSIAVKHHLNFIDHQDRMSSDPQAFHDAPYLMQAQESNSPKVYLRKLYEIIVDAGFHLRFVFVNPGRRVYLLLNWPALKNLLASRQGGLLNPVILARHFPKNLSFVLDCWRKNILLTRLPPSKFNKDDKKRFAEIVVDLEKALAAPASALERIQQKFILKNYVNLGLLRAAALEVISYERLFERHNISQLVVGDAENGTCRLLLELAFKKKIHADEMLNGMFLTDEFIDSRSGDDLHPPYVKRLLSWGEQNESWLAARNGDIPTVRTGYPALGSVNREFSASGRNKALILPISMEGVQAHSCNIFSTLVDTVRGLEVLGYGSIRIKVHVGHPVEKYFRDVAEYFDLDCEIYQTGGLADHIEWADMVIGPIDSGAFVETVSAGVPYYPMRLYPSSLKEKYFGPVEPFESVPQLLEAVRRQNYPEPEAFLEYFCSSDSISNASARVWEVLEEPFESD